MKESHHIDEDIIFDYKNNSPISLIEAEGIEVNDYLVISLLANNNKEKEDCYELIHLLKTLNNEPLDRDNSEMFLKGFLEVAQIYIDYNPAYITAYETHENPQEWEDEVINFVQAETGNKKLDEYMTFRAKEILRVNFNTKF